MNFPSRNHRVLPLGQSEIAALKTLGYNCGSLRSIDIQSDICALDGMLSVLVGLLGRIPDHSNPRATIWEKPI